MDLTREQKKLRRALKLLNWVAGSFEDGGNDGLQEPLDEACNMIEKVAVSLEALGLPEGVLD